MNMYAHIHITYTGVHLPLCSTHNQTHDMCTNIQWWTYVHVIDLYAHINTSCVQSKQTYSWIYTHAYWCNSSYVHAYSRVCSIHAEQTGTYIHDTYFNIKIHVHLQIDIATKLHAQNADKWIHAWMNKLKDSKQAYICTCNWSACGHILMYGHVTYVHEHIRT